jgi:undecaprenyl-diphosphatase
VATPGTAVESWRRDPRTGWLVIAVGALGAFLVVVALAMMWPAFRALDEWVSAAARSMRSPALTPLATWATFLGSMQFVLPATVLLALWMAVKRNWAAVVYVLMTVVVGWLIGNDVIKNLIKRPRPVGVNIVPITTDYSMPSSHSLAAFLFYATLCVIVMLNLPTGHHIKRWLAIVSALVILAVGWSRVYFGVHYVGDVLAAYLLGWAWWSFTTATYFGSVTEEKRVGARSVGPGASE